MENKFKVGDRVTFEFYGEERAGVVVRSSGSGIVFVTDDKTERTTWKHAESLTLDKRVETC